MVATVRKMTRNSAQFAVGWTTDGFGAPFVDRYTNAVAQSGARQEAAFWQVECAAKEHGIVFQEDEITPSANYVTVVLVYTDTLDGTPDKYESEGPDDRGKRAGDMPDVMGYWQGEKRDGKWYFWSCEPELTCDTLSKQYYGYPNAQKIETNVALATAAVSETGYTLRERPNKSYLLPGEMAPVTLKDLVAQLMAEWERNATDRNMTTIHALNHRIEALIAEAVDHKDIQSMNDTGFDIVPQPADPGYFV